MDDTGDLIVAHAINEAMAPFKARIVTIWIDATYDFLGDKVSMEIDILPGKTFKIRLDRGDVHRIDPETLWSDIGSQAGRYFSSFYIPPSSNCHLGEN